MIKNPPANARDVGSSPGPGRFPHAAEHMCATTTEASAVRAGALPQEKPLQ